MIYKKRETSWNKGLTKEDERVRKIMTVNQNESMNNRMPDYQMPQRRGSRWNPTNWGR